MVLEREWLSTAGEGLSPLLGPAVPGSPPGAWRGAFAYILPFGSAPLPVQIKQGEAARLKESHTLPSVCKMGHNARNSRVFTAMDLGILAELWAISNWDRKGNCNPQGLRSQATRNDSSPRKGQTESLTRKTVHQTQMLLCVCTSLGGCATLHAPPLASCKAALHCKPACISFCQKGNKKDMKSISLEEHFSTANHKLLLLKRSFFNWPFCCYNAVPFLQSAQICSAPSFLLHPTQPFMQPYLEAGTHTTAHKSFLPGEAFRFPPSPAPFHGRAGSVPTTTDCVLISQTPGAALSC